MPSPCSGTGDWNYWTKRVTGVANDKNGFSWQLACAGLQSCSSPHMLLGSSPWPRSKGSNVRGFLASGHQQLA